MTTPDRHLLIEKHEQGLLTSSEYEQYVDLLQHDPDFFNEVRLYQVLAQNARHQAHDDLWAASGQGIASEKEADPTPLPSWFFIRVQPSMVRWVALLILLTGSLGVGNWYYQRTIANRIIGARLPVYYLEPETGQQGMGFGSDDGSPNDSLAVLLLSSRTLPDASKAYYTLATDTLRLYLPAPSRQLIAGWRLTYDPVADRYQLVRAGKTTALPQTTRTTPLP